MPRLVVHAESAAQNFDLKPGVTSIGRSLENDCPIVDSSVSSRHAQITVSDGTARLTDLGSTNGTFVGNQPVQEVVLKAGQSIRFGSIACAFQDDSASPALPVAVAAPARIRVQAAAPVAAEGGTVMIPRAVPAARPAAPAPVGRVQAPLPRRGNFFALAGGAFAYPFMGSSIFFLICGTVAYVFLDFVSSFSLYLKVIFGGYTAAFSFNLCQSTAQNPNEPPSWPDVTEMLGDIITPFIQVTGVSLVCFGPAIFALFYGKILLALLLAILGGLYFPMAMLALSMFDSLVSINPLVVIPAIVKVPLEYLLVCVVFGALFLFRFACETYLNSVISVPFVPSMAAGLFSLYFLMVEMRLLGLLFYAKKDRFGWF